MTTLEKVQRLEHYLTVSGSSEDRIITVTIDKLIERERNKLHDVIAKLNKEKNSFETKYQLQSEDFYWRFEGGQMGDDIDFMEWASVIEMLRNANTGLKLLQ